MDQSRQLRLLDQVRERCRVKHYSIRTEKPLRLPMVLSTSEVQRLLAHLEGTHHLVASLLYGSGLRLLEALRLQVKDVDLDRLEITVRSGKDGKDRQTILPRPLVEPLARQIDRVAVFHERDVQNGLAPVYLPHALARKYPNAGRKRRRQSLFPAPLKPDPKQPPQHSALPTHPLRFPANPIRHRQIQRSRPFQTVIAPTRIIRVAFFACRSAVAARRSFLRG